jgi:hypothetical protein
MGYSWSMRGFRFALGLVVAVGATTTGFAACGGSTTNNIGDDASSDGAADVTTQDTGPGTDASDSGPASDGASDGNSDGGGPACAAPMDPSQGAVCITITPETIQFLQNDPRFDGKGIMVVALYSSATPPNDGGGVVGSPTLLPPQDGGSPDGGIVQMDLSQAVPVVRFDGVPPGTVYARAVFLDDVTVKPVNLAPGWWLGGYDLSGGLLAAPLVPVTVTAGVGTAVAMDLRAVRGLGVDLTTSVPPLGNGQGPFQMLLMDRANIGPDAGDLIFGLGQAPCADVLADGGAQVFGLFVGGGPLWILPELNDFGLMGNFPPGTMTSVDFDAGGLYIPQANEIEAGTAYLVAQPITVNYVVPGEAGVDTVTCP